MTIFAHSTAGKARRANVRSSRVLSLFCALGLGLAAVLPQGEALAVSADDGPAPLVGTRGSMEDLIQRVRQGRDAPSAGRYAAPSRDESGESPAEGNTAGTADRTGGTDGTEGDGSSFRAPRGPLAGADDARPVADRETDGDDENFDTLDTAADDDPALPAPRRAGGSLMEGTQLAPLPDLSDLAAPGTGEGDGAAVTAPEGGQPAAAKPEERRKDWNRAASATDATDGAGTTDGTEATPRAGAPSGERKSGGVAGSGGSSVVRGLVSTTPVNALVVEDGVLTARTLSGSDLRFEARPVLGGGPDGNTLDFVFIPSHGETPDGLRHGLYVFDEGGNLAGFVPELAANDCPAVYLSPDATLLAVDAGGPVNHRLYLFTWPALLPVDARLRYWPGEGTVVNAQTKEKLRRERARAEALAEEEAKAKGKKRRSSKSRADAKAAREALLSEPLVWYGRKGLVYRYMDTDTARPCGYEPCGVVSVRAWDPRSERERALCAGTELCDCVLLDLNGPDRKGVPVAKVGMQCSDNMGGWRTRDARKTSLSISVPLD